MGVLISFWSTFRRHDKYSKFLDTYLKQASLHSLESEKIIIDQL